MMVQMTMAMTVTTTLTMMKVMTAMVMAVAVWVLMTAMLLMMMSYVGRTPGDGVQTRTIAIMLLTMRNTCHSWHRLV